MRSPEPQCLRLSGREERRRSPSFLALVGPAVAVVAARSRVQPQNSTCPGGITCPGGCAGDQLGVSLGQPALDHATTLSAGCPRYLPVVPPVWCGQFVIFLLFLNYGPSGGFVFFLVF